MQRFQFVLTYNLDFPYKSELYSKTSEASLTKQVEELIAPYHIFQFKYINIISNNIFARNILKNSFWNNSCKTCEVYSMTKFSYPMYMYNIYICLICNK